MPDFAYTARSAAGDEVAGRISAATEREAVAMLGERALFPLKVHREQPSRKAWSAGQKRIKKQVLAITLAQLADLLESGVPLLRSLEVLAKQASQPLLAEVMTDVKNQVAEGNTLDAAMGRHPVVFGELTVSMVRAGGEG